MIQQTIEDSRTARRNSLRIQFDQKIAESRRVVEQLNRDIEDLKNKKIKEMEELLEIITKKERNVAELETIRAEIENNRRLLDQLRLVGLGPGKEGSSLTSSVKHSTQGGHVFIAATTASQLSSAEKHLPDLVKQVMLPGL